MMLLLHIFPTPPWWRGCST